MRQIKASDRPRNVRDGEDVVSWAVRTGRILAASADAYRGRIQRREITERDIEILAPVLAGRFVDDVQASGGPRHIGVVTRSAHPARGGEMYAASPAVERIRRESPAAFQAAVMESAAPKLFGVNHDRDLPLILASGLDPEILMEVPWQVRHRIAAEPSRAKVYELLEMYASDPDAAAYEYGPNSGSGIDNDPADVKARSANAAYENACFRWAAGTPNAAGQTIGEMTESEYGTLFPDS